VDIAFYVHQAGGAVPQVVDEKNVIHPTV